MKQYFVLLLFVFQITTAFGRIASQPSKFKGLCSCYLDLTCIDDLNADKVIKLESRKNVVDISQKYRKRFLSAAYDDVSREYLISSIMGDLKEKSRNILNRLKKYKLSNKYDEASQAYDVLVVGAGVQEGVIQNGFAQFGPDFKVVTIEQSDLVAKNFGISPDFFRINSTNRKEDFAVKARPGQGNINRLSGGNIQIPDLFAEKYPSARSIHTTTVLNRANSKNPILFKTEVISLIDSKKTGDNFPARYRVKLRNNGETFEVYSNVVIGATGLGKDKFPISDVASIKLIERERSRISKMTKKSKFLPKVMTFDDARQLITKLDKPFKNLVDKKVMVVGQGDSGKVTVEYLFKEGPEKGYKEKAQVGEVKEVVWAGATEQTCDEYIVGNRVRYSRIAASLKNQTLRPVEAKVVKIEDFRGGVKVTFDNGQEEVVDHVITATGYSKKYGDIFESIVGPNSGDLQKDEFLQTFRKPILGDRNSSTLALRLKKVGRFVQDIFFAGPSVNLIKDEPIELLAGVPQNSVSIFNNGDRNYSFIKYLTSMFNPSSFKRMPKASKIKIDKITRSDVSYLVELKSKKNTGTGLNSYSENYLLSRILSKIDKYNFTNFSKDLNIQVLKTKKEFEFVFKLNFNSKENEGLLRLVQEDQELARLINEYLSQERKNNVLNLNISLNQNKIDYDKTYMNYLRNDKVASSRGLPKILIKTVTDSEPLFDVLPLETLKPKKLKGKTSSKSSKKTKLEIRKDNADFKEFKFKNKIYSVELFQTIDNGRIGNYEVRVNRPRGTSSRPLSAFKDNLPTFKLLESESLDTVFLIYRANRVSGPSELIFWDVAGNANQGFSGRLFKFPTRDLKLNGTDELKSERPIDDGNSVELTFKSSTYKNTKKIEVDLSSETFIPGNFTEF